MNPSEFMPVGRFEEREKQRAEAASVDKLIVAVHPSTDRFLSLLDEIRDLHCKKGKDYGSDKDPFANVSASVEFGVRPWVAAMVRAMDKVRRIMKYAITGTLSNEGVMDSLKDLAVYVLIAIVLLEREWAAKSL